MSLGYEEHFAMKNAPFTRAIPPEHLYMSPNVMEVQSRIRFGIENAKFCILVGDTGVGKSTNIRAVASKLSPGRYQLIYLSESRLTPRKLYMGMLRQMGVEVRDFRRDLRRLWVETISPITDVEKRKVVCIIDDAHLVEEEVLEEIRFLINKDFDSCSYLSLILVGQPELLSVRLSQKHLEPIRQRADIPISLPGLDREETGAYIRAQLDYAAGKRELFTQEAIRAIYKLSNGVPRMVNHICDLSLNYASQACIEVIDDVLVQRICKGEMLVGTESG